MMALKQSNALFELDVAGKSTLALPKDVQRDPLRGFIEHVDLLIVRRGEKVTVDVPLAITGDVAAGGLLAQEHTSVTVQAEATHLPSEIAVSIEGLEIGSHITAGDLKLPQGCVLAGDPEQMLLLIQEAPTAADLEATEGEGIEQAAPAESPAAEAVPAEDAGSTTE
jgi:large subunit ribosomal protein L25